MPYYSMFGDNAPRYFRRMINDIREESLSEGVDPVDFPDYLKARGIHMEGAFFVVSDELMTFAELKYS